MIDLWERRADGSYAVQDEDTVAERLAANAAAFEHERTLPHNQRAHQVWYGIIAAGKGTPPNAWCHACGTSLNPYATIENGQRVFRWLNFTREARLVTITNQDGEVLHDCARDAFR